MSKVVPINHAALIDVAAEALDLIERYGEAVLVNVTDPAAVRRYVRNEARRRSQPIRSYWTVNAPDTVLVVVEDDELLTPAARAWRADSSDRIREAMRYFPSARPGPPMPRPWMLDVGGRA